MQGSGKVQSLVGSSSTVDSKEDDKTPTRIDHAVVEGETIGGTTITDKLADVAEESHAVEEPATPPNEVVLVVIDEYSCTVESATPTTREAAEVIEESLVVVEPASSSTEVAPEVVENPSARTELRHCKLQKFPSALHSLQRSLDQLLLQQELLAVFQ